MAGYEEHAAPTGRTARFPSVGAFSAGFASSRGSGWEGWSAPVRETPPVRCVSRPGVPVSPQDGTSVLLSDGQHGEGRVRVIWDHYATSPRDEAVPSSFANGAAQNQSSLALPSYHALIDPSTLSRKQLFPIAVTIIGLLRLAVGAAGLVFVAEAVVASPSNKLAAFSCAAAVSVIALPAVVALFGVVPGTFIWARHSRRSWELPPGGAAVCAVGAGVLDALIIVVWCAQSGDVGLFPVVVGAAISPIITHLLRFCRREMQGTKNGDSGSGTGGLPAILATGIVVAGALVSGIPERHDRMTPINHYWASSASAGMAMVFLGAFAGFRFILVDAAMRTPRRSPEVSAVPAADALLPNTSVATRQGRRRPFTQCVGVLAISTVSCIVFSTVFFTLAAILAHKWGLSAAVIQMRDPSTALREGFRCSLGYDNECSDNGVTGRYAAAVAALSTSVLLDFAIVASRGAVPLSLLHCSATSLAATVLSLPLPLLSHQPTSVWCTSAAGSALSLAGLLCFVVAARRRAHGVDNAVAQEWEETARQRRDQAAMLVDGTGTQQLPNSFPEVNSPCAQNSDYMGNVPGSLTSAAVEVRPLEADPLHGDVPTALTPVVANSPPER
eukprot:Hpha_TRINITY_DN11472_c0_g1::TRINITY_DN11472_c0_g1_i1::g.137415::m.137415